MVCRQWITNEHRQIHLYNMPGNEANAHLLATWCRQLWPQCSNCAKNTEGKEFTLLKPQKQLKWRVDIDSNIKRKVLMFTSREGNVSSLDSASEIWRQNWVLSSASLMFFVFLRRHSIAYVYLHGCSHSDTSLEPIVYTSLKDTGLCVYLCLDYPCSCTLKLASLQASSQIPKSPNFNFADINILCWNICMSPAH